MASTDWDRVAAEETARVAAEDAALARQSDAALGLNRASPSGAAEAEERTKRDALRAAKAAWQAREADALAAKHVVEGETGVTRVLTARDLADAETTTSADRSDDGDRNDSERHGETRRTLPDESDPFKNCRDGAYALDASLRVAKVFVENCENVVVTVRCLVITQTLEIWNCADVSLRFDEPVATVQADSCRDCALEFKKRNHFGAVVHATCEGSLCVRWPKETNVTSGDEPKTYSKESTSEGMTSIDLVLNEQGTSPAFGPVTLSKSGINETPQFITRLIDSVPTTERVIRDKDEYPTTAREMLLDRADLAKAGDADAMKAIERNEPIELDTSFARAEKRRVLGNDSFKNGDYAQAVVHYTSCLQLDGSNHVAYANRSACFLKLGEHERALADAERCVKIEPGFVKGRFRIGLALHALGRFAEAAAALAEAETLDPKNAQIKDALKMAAFKARQKGALGGS
jgi:hypothetical protein